MVEVCSKYNLFGFHVLAPAGNARALTRISNIDLVSIHQNITLPYSAECLFLGFTLPTLLTP